MHVDGDYAHIAEVRPHERPDSENAATEVVERRISLDIRLHRGDEAIRFSRV
jgi:hypothetical protein